MLGQNGGDGNEVLLWQAKCKKRHARRARRASIWTNGFDVKKCGLLGLDFE